MKKVLFTLLVLVFFVTGCQITKINTQSVNDIFNTILYVDDKLSNVYMDGYEFYLPKGMKIIDKHDYNLKIEDNNNYYYLYIDTIAYHYQTENSYTEKKNHFYSHKINYQNKSGFIDVVDDGDYYFVVIMYNYAKVETYIKKADFDSSIMNICYMLRSVRYNDKVISEHIGNNNMLFQEENFNIFDSKKESDNFLKYEAEYGTYKEKIDINKDNDVIDVTEIVE